VDSGTPEVHYTDIECGYSGTGTIDADPLFVGNGDYHLTSNEAASPCIDTGRDYAPELPSTDKDENARIIGAYPDMGAYEYEKYAPTVSTGAASSVTGSTANLSGTINPNGAISYYWFQFGTTTNYGSITPYTNVGDGKSNIAASFTKTGLSPATTYHYRIAAMSYGGTSYGGDRIFTTPYASTQYVCSDGNCGGNTPCHETIAEAVAAAQTGSLIKVANNGTYGGACTVSNKSLTIQGGWNTSFSSWSGTTTLQGAPKAQNGSVTLQQVNIVP